MVSGWVIVWLIMLLKLCMWWLNGFYGLYGVLVVKVLLVFGVGLLYSVVKLFLVLVGVVLFVLVGDVLLVLDCVGFLMVLVGIGVGILDCGRVLVGVLSVVLVVVGVIGMLVGVLLCVGLLVYVVSVVVSIRRGRVCRMFMLVCCRRGIEI